MNKKLLELLNSINEKKTEVKALDVKRRNEAWQQCLNK